MQPKKVYLDAEAIGVARNWHDVADLIAARLGQRPTRFWLWRFGHEAPDAFYISTKAPEGRGSRARPRRRLRAVVGVLARARRRHHRQVRAMTDPIIEALNARIQNMLAWLRLIAAEGLRGRRPRIELLAALAMAGEEPTNLKHWANRPIAERPDAARRALACLLACAGIGTEALERIARLGEPARFGALADLAKVHFLKGG